MFAMTPTTQGTGRAFVVLGVLALGMGPARPAGAAPDPRQIFAPLVLPGPPGRTRSAGGVPGPDYWQNRADYRIEATIDPATKTLSGREVITYTNNSPDALDVLWLQLEQNIYRRLARAAARAGTVARPPDQYTGGDELISVSVEQDGRVSTPARVVSDTRLQLRLARPVPAHGVVKLRIAWRFRVPATPWGGRMAVSTTPDGPIYEIAQWYPRMAVYDDLRGWDTAPYLGSEFYCEYGTFDYAVTVPDGWLVAGSGALVNPGAVLTATERARLARAAASEATVAIRTGAEVAAAHDTGGARTWRFHMEHTRDVVFAASPAFQWDAARMDLPGGRHALAAAVYPRGSAGTARWGRAVEYVKGALEYFSRQWAVYPWPSMTAVGGHGAEMEYPGMVFEDKADAGRDLFWITAHETGHSYFPMLVGSDERRDAWMDEGFNTFIDIGASDAFNHGEYGPKRDSEYAPGGGNPADEIRQWLNDPAAPVIMTPADQVSEKYRHPMEYFKPALGLVLLRDDILGKVRFEAAFRRYIAAWSYKHPSPSDFFRLMGSEAGEDLGWFWRSWFFENVPMDITLDDARYVDGTPADGVRVTVTAHAPLVLPVPLLARYVGGGEEAFTLPVEAFYLGMTARMVLPTTRAVAAVVMDPKGVLPNKTRPGALPLDPAGACCPRPHP